MLRRLTVVSAVLTLAALVSGAGPAQAAPAGGRPPGPHAIEKIVPRSTGPGGSVPVAGGRASLPAHGAPPVALKMPTYKALRAAMHKPRPTPAASHRSPPPKGTFVRLIGSAAAGHGHAYWNGSRWIAPRGAAPRPLPRRLPPLRPTGHAGLQKAFPLTLDPSTQVDSATATCTNPLPNEPSVAQSSDNPDLLVVAAQADVDSSGNCGDSHPWVFYSHDAGQHWREEIVPNLTAGLAGGDPAVVYDPKDHVFVYSFIQFSRTNSTNTINVTRSFDGVSWSFPLTLDAHPGMDKPMITVDRNPASPHFGRLLVAWRDDTVGQNALIDAFSDNGGGSWMGSSNTINTVPDCGNGASPAFDANGEAMVAWFDCNGGTSVVTRIEEGLSTDGGASWRQPSNTVISGVTDINTPGDVCQLNAGGSRFRCNSFPSLAGDPNPLDAGGRAFFVVFANWEPTTQAGQRANVSQLHGLSTVDGGGTWNAGNGAAFDYMAFNNFGDKFFPWASFSPNGRLNVGYSDREAGASAANPNGLSYNEGQAEASSLTSLRAASYIAYTADGTLGNPGSLSFIGDYSGVESQDNDFDTFPVWTDLRNGVLDVRTMDLCYIDCPAFLQPDTPTTALHAPRQSFLDFYQFNTDSSFGGAGTGVWNAVGIRETTDFTGIDDSIGLASSRYFSPLVARGDLPAPSNDYVLENDNPGHGPTKPYYVIVQPSGSAGGSYSVQWAPDLQAGLDTSLFSDMGASDIIRVFQLADSTGTTYHLGLRPSDGNTSSYRLSVHLNGNGTYQSSNQQAATSGNVAAGSPAFVTVSTGASPAGNDALVVQNTNGGTGGYTLFRDTAAPSGTISVNSGAASTSSTQVTLNLSATNPTGGDPVSDMRFSSDGVTYGAWVPFDATAPFTLPAGDGPKTVFAEFRNGAGAISAAASHSITLDTTAPAITAAPAPSFVTGQLGTTAVPILIKWTATDATSGINHYDLQKSVDGGPFSLVASPTTASATSNLLPGHTYKFEVRAIDNAGNVSGLTAGTQFTLNAFKETATRLTYTTGWTQQTLAGAYGGAVKFATAAGKHVTFPFTGSQVAVVSTIGTNRGSATVSLDGGAAATVNTNGTALKTAMVVYAKTVAAGTHSLLLNVLGTAGHPRVDVDGFLIIH